VNVSGIEGSFNLRDLVERVEDLATTVKVGETESQDHRDRPDRPEL